jgi:hypothetical protein
MEKLSNLIIIISAALPVVLTALYAGLIYRRLPDELKVLSWFIFLSAIVQVTSNILWLQSKNNLWLLHVYVATGFIILAWFYDSVFKGFINRLVIRIVTILFVLFTLINAVFIQGFLTYAAVSLTVESVLIIILSLSLFILLLNDIVRESKGARLVKSLNWINSGLFLYYTSGLLIFYFGEFLTRSLNKNFTVSAWLLHFFFLTVMHVCFFIGLWNRPTA